MINSFIAIISNNIIIAVFISNEAYLLCELQHSQAGVKFAQRGGRVRRLLVWSQPPAGALRTTTPGGTSPRRTSSAIGRWPSQRIYF